MKFVLACLMLSVMALVVSARNEHHCKKSDAEMKKLIACVIAKVPDASSFYDTLDKMVKDLGCTERLCAVRKLCGHEDTVSMFDPLSGEPLWRIRVAREAERK
ncbi:unnamed protein product [Ixodes pacificus]